MAEKTWFSTKFNFVNVFNHWTSMSWSAKKINICNHLLFSRDRPDFPSLAQTLERLPKKRLARYHCNYNYKRYHKFMKTSYLLFVIMDILLMICNLHLEISYLLFMISDLLLMICNLHLQISFLLLMILYLLLMICNLQVSFPPNPSVAQCRGALLRTRTSMWPHMMISIHDHWSDDQICMMIIVKHICRQCNSVLTRIWKSTLLNSTPPWRRRACLPVLIDCGDQVIGKSQSTL